MQPFFIFPGDHSHHILVANGKRIGYRAGLICIYPFYQSPGCAQTHNLVIHFLYIIGNALVKLFFSYGLVKRLFCAAGGSKLCRFSGSRIFCFFAGLYFLCEVGYLICLLKIFLIFYLYIMIPVFCLHNSFITGFPFKTKIIECFYHLPVGKISKISKPELRSFIIRIFYRQLLKRGSAGNGFLYTVYPVFGNRICNSGLTGLRIKCGYQYMPRLHRVRQYLSINHFCNGYAACIIIRPESFSRLQSKYGILLRYLDPAFVDIAVEVS